MTSSCPYCGAALKLKFCVVCGRQSKLNKMGNLRSVARNTDITTRLQDPFLQEDLDPQKALRFKISIKPAADAAFGGLIAGILIFCAIREAIDLYTENNLHRLVIPWIKTYRISFPNNWPISLSINPSNKKLNPSKSKKKNSTCASTPKKKKINHQ